MFARIFPRPSQSAELIQLFSLLSQGEKIAHRSAIVQAQQMNTCGRRSQAKFLRTQARHELFHSKVFDSTVLFLGGKTNTTKFHCLNRYASYLEKSLNSGAIIESLLATQVVLENLGKLALQGIDGRMEQQGKGLEKIRSVILAQEDEHHHFGQSELLSLMQDEGVQIDTVRQLTQLYAELAFDILDEVAPLFDALDSDNERFKHNLLNEMPAWLNIDLASS